MAKLPPPVSSRRVPFLQRQDWLISAGLVLVIYFLMLLLIHLFVPDSRVIRYLVHVLPLLAAGMGWKGINERGELMERARTIRAKRRHAEMDLKKLSKTQNPAGADSAGEEKKK